MLYLQSEDAAKSENVILGVRACLKNHSRNLHAPLCGIFHPNSVAVAHYGRTLIVQDEPQFFGAIRVANKTTRRMPLYSVPGLYKL